MALCRLADRVIVLAGLALGNNIFVSAAKGRTLNHPPNSHFKAMFGGLPVVGEL